MTMGIYKITCKPTGRKYVGSAVNISERFDEHCGELIAGTHKNEFMQKAWNKYGINKFDFSTVERVEDRSLLLVREQWYLDNEIIWGFDFNFARRADCPPGRPGGWKHTEESLEKFRRNIKSPKFTTKGLKFSAETKAKMSKSHKGVIRVLSPEEKKKRSDAAREMNRKRRESGWKRSLESNKKTSDSLKKTYRGNK